MNRYAVIATRLRAGQTVIRVLSEERGVPPGPGFEPVDTSLEDVYFATLHRLRAQSSVREAKAAIVEKHGSRKAVAPTRRARAQARNAAHSAQLSLGWD